MDLGLKGKRALVAGASAGLGAAAAETLAAEGATVVINSRSEERLEAMADRIAELTGHRPETAVGDLSAADDLRRVVKTAGAIDILVSNTGGPPQGAFLDHTPDKFEAAAHLVLDSAVGLTRAFLPGMV
jgi:3-oxoacyl-[acyl-carrier protein] reductase